jgi:hypothetical protein
VVAEGGVVRKTDILEGMRQPVILEGPGASTEDVAATFGISKKRQAAINEIVKSVLGKGKPSRSGSQRKRSTSRKSAETGANRK